MHAASGGIAQSRRHGGAPFKTLRPPGVFPPAPPLYFKIINIGQTCIAGLGIYILFFYFFPLKSTPVKK
jgi:hypothetical protein